MGNHFHLVLETPQANLVAGMQWFLGTYTSRFNRHGRDSALTQPVGKRMQILGERCERSHRLVRALFRKRHQMVFCPGIDSRPLRVDDVKVADYLALGPEDSRLLLAHHPLRM